MISIGVIGCGHWGPNHIRVFNQLPDSRVPICADPDENRRKAIQTVYPSVRMVSSAEELIASPDLDAVCIATPTDTHYELAKSALAAGKHVFCEKPLTLHAAECAELDTLARQAGKVLMVGHIFVFNHGIERLKQYVQSGELGRVYYAHSERTNLGPFRYDVNALWDLAPHDIAIFNYLFDGMPVNVSARGQKYLNPDREDLAFASMQYSDNVLVNVHVSWLDPRKVRQITIVGDHKMAVWDDLDPVGPIKLYDKYVERTSKFYETYGEFQLLSREGSITIPHLGFHEPLKVQAQYFLDCVKSGQPAGKADAAKAEAVVRTLTAIQKSMDAQGAPVDV